MRVTPLALLFACGIGCNHAVPEVRPPTPVPQPLPPPQCGVDLESRSPADRLDALETLQTCVWLEPDEVRRIVDRFYADALETTSDPAIVNAEWSAALRRLGDEDSANTKWQAAVDAAYEAGEPNALVRRAHALITAGHCAAAQALRPRVPHRLGRSRGHAKR